MAKNKPFESSVPIELLLKGTVSAPILNGYTLRESDVVGTLSVLQHDGRILLVTCEHVFRRWGDLGPLVAPILEVDIEDGKGVQKWITVNLKRFRWLGFKLGVTTEELDGYFDIRVALLPEPEKELINQDLILPVQRASAIGDVFNAVLTGYPERKNTKDKIRKRKPHPWAKTWWYEMLSTDAPTANKRLEFAWSHKSGNYIFEQQTANDKAKFVSTGSAPLPHGVSGGPLIFLGSRSDSTVSPSTVVGYGMEYDQEAKKIIAGPSDVIIDIGDALINREANGEILVKGDILPRMADI